MKLGFSVIRAESRKRLKDILQAFRHHPGDLIVCNCSGILDSGEIPEDFSVYNFGFYVPNPILMDIYFENGYSEKYIVQYLHYLNNAECAFFINEIIRTCLIRKADCVWACMDDEKDFGHIRMICKFIEDNFGIDAISVGGYLNGKKSSIDMELKDLMRLIDERRNMLLNKMDALGIELPSNLCHRITVKMLKDTISKEGRKLLKKELRKMPDPIKRNALDELYAKFMLRYGKEKKKGKWKGRGLV